MIRSALTFPATSFILALLGTGLWYQSSLARPVSGRAASSQGQEIFKDLGTVRGRGTTKEEAREDAARKAQQKIVSFLHKQGFPSEEAPALDFIRDRLLKGPGEHLSKDDKVVLDETVQCWSWPLVIERRDWDLILYWDQHGRAERRMVWLAKLMAGLVALLAAVFGYIRLDEWTRRRYTGWLRLGAGGLAALTAVGLWWLL